MEAQVNQLSRLIQEYVMHRVSERPEEAEKLMLNIPEELHEAVITCAFNMTRNELPMQYSVMINVCRKYILENKPTKELVGFCFDMLAYDSFMNYIQSNKPRGNKTFVNDLMQSNDPELKEIAKELL